MSAPTTIPIKAIIGSTKVTAVTATARNMPQADMKLPLTAVDSLPRRLIPIMNKADATI